MRNQPFVLAVHGGAGSITNQVISPAKEKEARNALESALAAGYALLEEGGSSLDAVEAAVRLLEDAPVFNAGKGATFNKEGGIELDASIMDGKTRRAGAVAGTTTVKNPVSAARAVMEKSAHVLLVGRGADQFAAAVGLEIVKPSYFWTPERWEELQGQLNNERRPPKRRTGTRPAGRAEKFGTVGAVALDMGGNLAAATSTGGISNKQFGRVGDSPIVGAGTYAENDCCAVSATGQGEFFIRYVLAYDIVALMKYKGLSIEQATARAIHQTLKEAGGQGGVIAVDGRGHVAIDFNTEGMYRGYILPGGKPQVAIFR